MFDKKEKIWRPLMFLCISVSIVFGLIVLNTVSSYADEEDTLYDTVPVFADGSEGELVHPIKITGGSGNNERTMYLVKLPENTTTVKFYDSSDDQNQYYNSPKQQGCANFNKTFLKKDYYNDGWWTINVSDLSFKTRTVWYNNLKTITDYYVKEAEYYELIPEAGNTKDTKAHFFIQIGDSDHPLDVYAASDGVRGDYFNEDSQIEIALHLTNNRDGKITDSNQNIYYTTDNTDPTSSNTAIKYAEPFVVTRSCTIQAAVKVTDDKWGEVIQAQCVINLPLPTFSPAEGSYFGEQEVSLSSDQADAEIFYSTDGTEPIPVDDDGNLVENESIKKYESPIIVDKNQTIKAVAVKKGENVFGDEVYIVSAVASAKYTLSTGIDVQFNGEDQGVWLIGSTINTPMFGFENEGTIVTPHGRSKCSVIISADENAKLMLNGQPVQREVSGGNAGKYLVDLDVLEAENTHGDDGRENVITINNGDDSAEYSIWCIASKYDDVPDKVTDYYVPSSQYTNNGLYGVAPNRTLIGKPDFVNGASTGNFGGYITWYYEDGIKNDPKNPYGVDFMVIGNSFDGTNEAAEPGNILVSEDGENWYTLAGSIHYDDNAIWNQKVTYTKDEYGFAEYEFADNNELGSGASRFLYPDLFYYPLHGDRDAESFTTKGTLLIPDGGLNAYGNVRPPYPAFGYADVGGSRHCSNEAENPYGGLFADATFGDRFTTNRNGDACDIAWAVDDEGQSVKLDKIHYIKVQTASFIDDGAIGEKSTEVNVMRVAKAADSEVGVTSAPESIKIDGQEAELKPFETVDVDVTGIFDIAVDAPEDTNVYINSIKSHTAYMNEAPHGIVRVIVQEGEKEPLIYYYKINQTPDSNTVTAVTFWTRAGNNNTTLLNGLLHDKDSLTCYYDEDTIEHFGGEVPFDEADPAKETQAFLRWQDADGAAYKAFDHTMAQAGGEIRLTAEFAKKSDVEAAKEVEELIDALPAATDVEGTDAEAIAKARAAYDALTDDQKELVSADAVTKLTALEEAIPGKVEAMIDALPAASAITEDDEEAVKAAKAAFDALSDTGKAAISSAKASKLFEDAAAVYQKAAETAEAKVEALESQVAALQAEADNAAQKVAEAEARLKELEESGETDKEAIKKAQEELEAAKKERDDAESKLKKAEEDLAAAEKKASDAETAAKQVADSYEEELALIKAQNAILKKSVKKLQAKAKKGSALVSWKKVGSGFTYEVYRSTNPTKSFKKVKTLKKLKVTVKKLKKGKTYYFKARAFKKVGGKKVYTGWSNIAKAKIKK